MNRTAFATPQGPISVCHWNDDAALAPSGEKPILHWAHANGFNGQTYDKLLAPLADRLDIYGWDARGHGFTQLPANPDEMKSWAIYAQDLEHLIARLHVKSGQKIWLGGHSMGGCASIMLAAKRPDMVAGLVLTDPVILPLRAVWIVPIMMALRGKGHVLMEMAKRRRRHWPDLATIEKAYTGRGAFASWQDGFLKDYLLGGLLPLEDGHQAELQNSVTLACDPQWEAVNFKGPQFNTVPLIKKLRVPFSLLMAEIGSTTRAGNAFEGLSVDKTISVIAGSTHFVPMEFPDLVRQAIMARICGAA
jgi:pimeloyl-ACP methyl ester carboxylesterase